MPKQSKYYYLSCGLLWGKLIKMSKTSNSGWKPFRRCNWVHRMEGRPHEASTSWRWGMEVERGGIWRKGRRAARTENEEETVKVKHGHRGCLPCNLAKSWPPRRFFQWPKVLNWHMLTYISSINYWLPLSKGGKIRQWEPREQSNKCPGAQH